MDRTIAKGFGSPIRSVPFFLLPAIEARLLVVFRLL